MPVTVDDLTTEVIAEPAQQYSDSPLSDNNVKGSTSNRTELAAMVRLDLRTRAEGFDD